jgi:mitosis inhibitor protein kinase SWE1
MTTLTGADMGDDEGANQDGDTSTSSVSSMRAPKSLEREGDREYIAPEIMQGKYSEAADVFSLGLVILEAAGNVILPDNGDAWQKLRNDDLSDVDLSQFSMSLVNLIRACLASDPKRRPTVEDLHAHPVLRAVSERVAMGVEKSELDQLPIFDMTTGESNRSLNSLQKRGVQVNVTQAELQSSGDTEMLHLEDDRQFDFAPSTPKPTTGVPPSNQENGASGKMAAAMMERTSSGQSALGLEGVEDDDKVLDVRGALIYESLDFLITILEAEPNAEDRMTMSILEHSKRTHLHYNDTTPSGVHFQDVPTINVDMEADDPSGSFVNGSLRISHAPPRASPLRHTAHEEDLDDMEMDL